MLDPDDCTFWYTNEYLKQAGLFNWSTRVFNWSFGSSNCTSLASITLPIPNAQGGAALTSATATFLGRRAPALQPTRWPSAARRVAATTAAVRRAIGAGTYTATLSCLPYDGSTFWVRLTTITPRAASRTTNTRRRCSHKRRRRRLVPPRILPPTAQSVSFTATVTAGREPRNHGTVQFVVDGTTSVSAVALTGSG